MNGTPFLFGPHQASRDELEATSVARRPVIEQLAADLAADARKKTGRHWQIVGPRGCGKSHLAEMVSRRLAADPRWAVVRLPEEHHQISNVGELLEQIVVRLEAAAESPLAALDDPLALEEAALDRIRGWRRQHGRFVVVVLEHLDVLFERRLRDRRDQGRLREILSRDAPFVVLGTATRYADATVRHEAPFYDFFQIVALDELAVDDVVALVEARTRWDLEEPLLVQIAAVRARVRAAFHFCGGSPRLALALYAILRHGFHDGLHAQLLALLDEMTPSYQQRLGEASPQMERILVELALAGRALTPADLGRRCRLPVSQVTANVAKLQAQRLVRPVGRPDKRRRYYDVSERLFRIWIQVRAGRPAPRRLESLARFFQRWYEEERTDVPPVGGRRARTPSKLPARIGWTALAAHEGPRRFLQPLTASDSAPARDGRGPGSAHERTLTALIEASQRGTLHLDDAVVALAASGTSGAWHAAFVAWAPAIIQTRPDQIGALLRTYAALRDRGVLPADLLPYAPALEIVAAPERAVALSPEVREAVNLILGKPIAPTGAAP